MDGLLALAVAGKRSRDSLEWHLIYTTTPTAGSTLLDVTTDMNGDAFALREFVVEVDAPIADGTRIFNIMLHNAEADSFTSVVYAQGALSGSARYSTVMCRSIGGSWHCIWIGNNGTNTAAANITGQAGEYFRNNPTATKPDPVAEKIRLTCSGAGFVAGTQVRIWGRNSL